VDRAYQFWFNDEDQPSMHASSGLTRNYEPKPSFHAAAHLRWALGRYRWARDVRRDRDIHAMEFVRSDDPREVAWVVWTPTREGAARETTLEGWRGAFRRTERMPLADGDAQAVDVRIEGERLTLKADGSPVFVFGRR